MPSVTIVDQWLTNPAWPALYERDIAELARVFTPIFSDGFESGDYSAWTGRTLSGSGTISVVGDIKHHGKYAAKAIKTLNTDGAYYYETFTTATHLYARGYFYLQAVNMGEAWDYDLIMTLGVGAARNCAVALYNENDGLASIELYDYVGYTHVDSGINMVTGQWYCIELEVFCNAAGYMKLYINGELKATKNYDTSAFALTRGSFGDVRNAASSIHSMTLYFDCAVVADTYIGVDDATLVSDSPTYNMVRAASPLEALGSIVDSIALVATRAKSVSEAGISVSDAPSRGLFKSLSVNEPSVSVSDSTQRILFRVIGILEALGAVSDAVSLAATRDVPLTESLGSVSDAMARAITRMISILEPSISASDAVSYNLRRAISILESLGAILDVAGTEVIVSATERSAIENLGSLSDTPSLTLYRIVGVSEPSMSATDAVSALVLISRAASESMGSPTDIVTYIITRSIALSEPTISVADSPTLLFIRAAAISEPSISVGDAASANLFLLRASSESLGAVTDSVAKLIQRIIEVTEALGTVSDSSAITLTRTIPVDESLGTITDGASLNIYRIKNLSEPLGSVGDSASLASTRVVPISESLGAILDAVMTSTRRSVSLGETLGSIADDAALALVKSILTSEFLGSVSDAVDIGKFYAVFITENLGAVIVLVENVKELGRRYTRRGEVAELGNKIET